MDAMDVMDSMDVRDDGGDRGRSGPSLTVGLPHVCRLLVALSRCRHRVRKAALFLDSWAARTNNLPLLGQWRAPSIGGAFGVAARLKEEDAHGSCY